MHGIPRTFSSAASLPGRGPAQAGGWTAWLRLCLARFRERRSLQELDDRELRDIGLSRSDVMRESRRWPWDGPPRPF